MRRNARSNQHDDFLVSALPLRRIAHDDSVLSENCSQMKFISSKELSMPTYAHRFENSIEAKVEIGDTLQAIALRFHCSVADIKRLNKIDKDNEIHARKVIKIPLTIHNVLLDNFPSVHKSGNSSPKSEKFFENDGSQDSYNGLNSIIRNPLEDAEAMLSEKLMVASVNSSEIEKTKQIEPAEPDLVNKIVLNSKVKSVANHEDMLSSYQDDISAPLLPHILDDSTNIPQLHRIKGPSFHALDWPGSDCDMSWICLFIVILALCFVIPLVYVFYIAEHSHHNTTGNIHTAHL